MSHTGRIFGWMGKVYGAEQVAVEQLQLGNTLTIPCEGGLLPQFFRVKSQRIDRGSDESTLIILESDPLPGESLRWVLTYTVGALVAQVVGYRKE